MFDDEDMGMHGFKSPEEAIEGMTRFLDMLKRKYGDGRHVIQRIPVKPEWKVRFEAMHAHRDMISDMEDKAKSLHRIAWAHVEEETGITNDMTYKDEEQVILVYGKGPKVKPEEITPDSIIGTPPATPPEAPKAPNA